MLIKEELVKKIAKRKGLDPRLVRLIADYPLKFTRDRMADRDELRPVRIRYLGVFALKPRFKDVKEYYPDGKL